MRSFLLILCAWLACVLPAHAAPLRNHLTVGIQLEPSSLDPTSGAAAAIDEVMTGSVYETLIQFDRAGQLRPMLALSWQKAPDGLSYEFRLRPNVRFHDGSLFDANAVKFSLLRAVAPNSTNVQRQALSVISGIDVLAPDRVRLRLSHPDANLLYTLAFGDAVMLSPGHADHLATVPDGTGPMAFVAWKRGDSVSLKRFDGYWGGPARLDGVTFRFIADPTAALAAMRAGDVQMFTDFPAPESMPAFQKDPRFHVIIGPSEGEVILAMNNRAGPLSDIRVRRALAFAIDRRAIIDGAMYGYGTPIGSHFPPQNAAYEDLTGLYAHNPEMAKRLLTEAGYPKGFDLWLDLPPPVYARRGGEIIANQMAAVGVRVHIRNVEWAQWLDKVYARHDYDLTVIDHAEPLDYANYGRQDYYWGFDSPAIRATLAQLSQTDAPREREALLRTVQRQIAEASPNAFLFQFPRLFVSDARIKDIWLNTPTVSLDWAHGYIEGAVSADTRPTSVAPGWLWPLIGAAVIIAGLVAAGRVLGPRYLLNKGAVLAVTLLGASFVVFAVTQLLPGDPAGYMMGLNASPQALAALREDLGLNAPAWLRYVRWLGGLLHGDFGTSYVYRAPVVDLIAERLGLSLPLAGLAIAMAVAMGILAGIISALRRGKASDHVLQGVMEFGIATPNYVVSILLVFVAAVVFRLVPSGGFPGWDAGLGAGLSALILPAFALALPQAAVIAKTLRASLISALDAPLITAARARGLPLRLIVWRHALPNGLQPVVALLGLQIPYLLAGSAIIESVFSLPGLGRLAFQAVGQRDLIVVEGVVMVLVALVVVSGFISDVAAAWLDPRLHKGGGR